MDGKRRQYTPPLTLSNEEIGAIERVERDDGSVVYKRLRILAPGRWTDSGSKETIWYSPEGVRNLEITEDNAVNIMHDLDGSGEANEASTVGHLDPESSQTDSEGNKYADLVLHMDNAASEYADENLQAALESNGEVGFGGPSVEIPADGQELEYDDSQGLYELVDGKIDGLGLVFDPAAKSIDFSYETQRRAVALSDGSQEAIYLENRDDSMNAGKIREKLNLSVDVDDETLVEMAKAGALDLELEDEDEEGEEEEEEAEDEEGEEEEEEAEDEEMEEGDEEEEVPEGDDEDDEEEEDTEMEGDELRQEVETLRSEVDELKAELGNLMDKMAEQSELEEATGELKTELADADTVEEIEARLSSIEDEPKEPRIMSDEDETTDSDDFDWSNVDEGVRHDSARGSTSY